MHCSGPVIIPKEESVSRYSSLPRFETSQCDTNVVDLFEMNFISIDEPPRFPYVVPAVSNAKIIGQYGIDNEDQVIKDAKAPKYKSLSKPYPKIFYDNDSMYDSFNPINRGMFIPPSPENELYIISNRGILKDILNCFLFKEPTHHPQRKGHRDVAPFQVQRKGNLIYFGETEKIHGLKQYEDGHEPKGYGITLEKMLSVGGSPNMHGFYRFNSFTLLKGVNMIVRSEIDAVNEEGEYYEIKARLYHDPNYHPLQDISLMREYWGQMFLGLAHSLVLGLYLEVDDKKCAELVEVDLIPTNIVQQQAFVDPTSLQRFATLLRWVQEHIADGEKKLMSYTIAEGGFSLRPRPSSLDGLVSTTVSPEGVVIEGESDEESMYW